MQIYLAGPDVFLPDPLKIAHEKQTICQKYGFVGRFPLDQTLDLEQLSPWDAGLAIYRSNIQLMNDCDLIVANMTPFRGPSLDAGTAFEMGYMTALGKPVFGYSNDGRLYGARVTGQGTPLRDHLEMLIEQFEMVDNLMIEGAIAESQGAIIYDRVEPEVYYTELKVFEQVIEIAAQTLS
ncbi:MAG: nucleoside 2-deoxyribosyltransferase [Oscillatoriales cyanobacterium RM2_1_1]|nr:nucleoside 2-deoxyribosyltransferase [Oscillatoriales cyanobacterium SM2_3_0]NJO46864.1 nucleoside 2-deoxyribosyltransferase [Oscillatoriales cyanobacterium RM2_1_1]